MKIKAIIILLILVMSMVGLSGCTSEEEESHTGIIQDIKYREGGFGKSERMTILFEDGKTVTFKQSSKEYYIQGIYLVAKNNIGNRVRIVYESGASGYFLKEFKVLESGIE